MGFELVREGEIFSMNNKFCSFISMLISSVQCFLNMTYNSDYMREARLVTTRHRLN